MLRGRMGDEAFLKMLGQIVARYRYKPITTNSSATSRLSYAAQSTGSETGIVLRAVGLRDGMSTLKMSQSASGRMPAVRVRGTITQSDVDEDFSTYIPIEALLPGKKAIVKWVQTSSEPCLSP